jgi:hypothetical protein
LAFSAGFEGWFVEGILVGKRSSKRVCQSMFGGLLMMLKMANLITGAKLRVNGVFAGSH